MPYHVIRTKLQEKLRRQRRLQLLESGAVGLVLTALFMGLLSVFLIVTESKDIPVAIDYRYELEPQIKPNKQPREVVKKIPTPPPAWVAGDEVELIDQWGNYKVTHGKDEFEWQFILGARPYVPKHKNKLPHAQWLKPTREEILRSKRFVKHMPLVCGTVWEHGIDMALSMNPKPKKPC